MAQEAGEDVASARRGAPRAGGPLVLALPLALLLAGCRPAPEAAPPHQRLGLGPSELLRLGNETRPALRLRPGEARSCVVTLPATTRLVLAVGALPGAPSRGSVRVAVSADGRELGRVAFPIAARWQRRTLELPASGRVSLELRVDHPAAPAVGEAGEDAWIALAVPRLYRAPAAAPGRVLVWISQDALRADHLGAHGYTRNTSPRFDAFAREAVLFENAVATASWTLPSLASQFTGRYPAWNRAVLPELAADDPTLFESLAAAGFTVLGVTGNQFVGPGNGLARGFDALWHSPLRAERLSRLAEGALEEWGGGDLALFVHYMDPHLPYGPPPPWDRAFTDPGYAGGVTGINAFEQVYRRIGPADREQLVGLYDGEIAYADERIGALLDGLARRGLLAKAVVALTADHGEEFREHGRWLHCTTLYQEVLHVPCVLKVPGLAARRVAEPVSLVSLAPTLLDALGIPAPASFQGRSLLPWLRGGPPPEREVYAETILNRDRHQLLAVRSGSLKYVLTVPHGRETAPPILREELYDLASDPRETTSRLDAPEAARLRRLALAYLARARSEAGPARPARLDADTVEELKAWGYLQ